MNKEQAIRAAVLQNKLLAQQVCVPREWSDQEVIDWLEGGNPCGTSGGWHLCEDGDNALRGSPARVQCAQQPGWVHRVLVA